MSCSCLVLCFGALGRSRPALCFGLVVGPERSGGVVSLVMEMFFQFRIKIKHRSRTSGKVLKSSWTEIPLPVCQKKEWKTWLGSYKPSLYP